MGKAVDVVHLHFSKAFGTVFHSLLSTKLVRNRLDKCVKRWMENWLDCQGSESCDQWCKVQLAASSLMSSLTTWMTESTLSKPADDTELEGAVNTLDGRAAS